MGKRTEVNETPRQYYNRVLAAKLKNSLDLQDVELDMVTYRADRGWCLKCGNPKMDDAVLASECRSCSVKIHGESGVQYLQELRDIKPLRSKVDVIASVKRLAEIKNVDQKIL